MILTILVAFLTSFSWGNTSSIQSLCLVKYAPILKQVADEANTNDKHKHCFVSCGLTLKCKSSDVLLLGVGKEIWDVLGPGDADIEDIVADLRGIELAERGTATNNGQCYNQCLNYYP